MLYESDDQRRRDALTLGYRSLAASLLRDECPSDHDLVLILVATVDAAIAGDRTVLELVPQVADRLETYLPAAEWSGPWSGRLWALTAISDMARVLLEVERQMALS